MRPIERDQRHVIVRRYSTSTVLGFRHGRRAEVENVPSTGAGSHDRSFPQQPVGSGFEFGQPAQCAQAGHEEVLATPVDDE